MEIFANEDVSRQVTERINTVRRAANLPEVRPDVVIPQQAKRDMGYSPENSLLFWQGLASHEGWRRFFVLSVPKEPVLNLIKTLKSAGLRPDNIETATFALCRAINQPQAIIIVVEPNSLSSIIMRDAIPVTTQSTFLGEEPREMESLPGLATDALEGIMAFHNESNPDNPLSPDIPVYLFGSAVPVNPDIVSEIEAALGRPVSEFDPPLVYPPDFPKAELAINIGLVLKKLRRPAPTLEKPKPEKKSKLATSMSSSLEKLRKLSLRWRRRKEKSETVE